MADKISDVFNANPSAGNDPTKDFSTPADFGEGTQEAYSNEQTANMVAYQLGIPENLPNQDTFSARFPDNSLVATVDALQTSYVYYVINTTGTTPTGGGSTGAIGFTAADWDSHTYYLFISDNDSTYVQVEPDTNDTNNDGLTPPGLELTPRYILPPSEITDLSIDTPVDGSGELVINFTAPTIPNGTKSTEAVVTRTDTNVEVKRFASATTGMTLGGLPNAIELDVVVLVTGNNDLQSISNTATETIPADTTAAYDGEIYIVKTSEYRETEGDNVVITFGLRNRQSTNTVTANVVTVDDTLKVGTNFTALGSPETISFASGDTTDTVTISTLIPTGGESTNKVAQIHIVPASQSGTADIAVYPDNAALWYLDGTGGGAGTVFEVDDVVGGTTAKGVVIEAENSSSRDDKGLSGDDTWATIPALTSPFSSPRDHADNNNTGVIYVKTGSFSSVTASPQVNYLFNTNGETGTYYLYARVYARVGWENRFFVGLDGAESFSNPTGETVKVDPADKYKWRLVEDEAGTNITVNITTDGDHTLNVWCSQDWLVFDKLILSKSASLSPGSVGASGTSSNTPDTIGPAESSYVATVVQDNPSNIGSPTNPVPPSGTLDPTTIIPVSGTSGIGTTAKVIATWPIGVSSIQVLTFTETAGGSPIVGTHAVTADNVLEWTPSQARALNTQSTIAATGTIVNTANAVVNWSISGHTFTTINTAGVVFEMDLSPYSDGQFLNSQDIFNIFGAGGGDVLDANMANGNAQVVVDPFSGSGDKVLKVKFPENGAGNGSVAKPCGFEAVKTMASSYSSLFMMFEMALGPGWISPAGIHLPRIRSGSYTISSTPTPDTFSIEHQLVGNNAYVDSNWVTYVGATQGPYPLSKDNGCNAYTYHQAGTQKQRWGNPDEPTQYFNVYLPIANQTIWEEGVYHQVEMWANVNTAGVADGDYRMWYDSQLAVDMANIKLRGDSSTELLKKWHFHFWVGGDKNDPRNWIPPASVMGATEQYMYVRRFILSTTAISH